MPPPSPSRKPSMINLDLEKKVIQVEVTDFHRPSGHGIHVGDRVEYTIKVYSSHDETWDVVRQYKEFKNLEICTKNFRHKDHKFPGAVGHTWFHEIFDPAKMNEDHVSEKLTAWLNDLVQWMAKSEELQHYLHEFHNNNHDEREGQPPEDFEAPREGYLSPNLLTTGILLSLFGF